MHKLEHEFSTKGTTVAAWGIFRPAVVNSVGRIEYTLPLLFQNTGDGAAAHDPSHHDPTVSKAMVFMRGEPTQHNADKATSIAELQATDTDLSMVVLKHRKASTGATGVDDRCITVKENLCRNTLTLPSIAVTGLQEDTLAALETDNAAPGEDAVTGDAASLCAATTPAYAALRCKVYQQCGSMLRRIATISDMEVRANDTCMQIVCNDTSSLPQRSNCKLFTVMHRDSDYPEWPSAPQQNNFLAEAAFEGCNCAPVKGLTRAFTTYGGDPDIMLMQMSRESVAESNKLLHLAAVLEHSAAAVLAANPKREVGVRQAFDTLMQEINMNLVATVAGDAFATNTSATTLQRSIPVFPGEESAGWGETRAPSASNAGVTIQPVARNREDRSLDSIFCLRMTDAVGSLRRRKSGGAPHNACQGTNHIKLSSTLHFLTLADSARLVQNPASFNNGLFAHIDTSLFEEHAGRVPCRILAQNLTARPSASYMNILSNTRYGFDNLLRYMHNHNHNTRRLRPQGIATQATNCTAIPHTLALHGRAETTADHYRIRLAAFGDFTCAVDTKHGELLVQCDSPLANDEVLFPEELESLVESTNTATALSDGSSNSNGKPGHGNTTTRKPPRLPQPQFSHKPKQLATKLVTSPHTLRECAHNLACLLPSVARLLPTGKFSMHDAILASSTPLAAGDNASPGTQDPLSTTQQLQLRHITNAIGIVQRAEERQGDCNHYSKIKRMLHTQQLGRVLQVTPLAAGPGTVTTNNRAVVMVKHTPPHTGQVDFHCLFLDRQLGTDPDFFSNDVRLNAEDLRRASSVRNALGIADTDTNPVFDRCWRVAVVGSAAQSKQMGDVNPTTKQRCYFAVRWKPSPFDIFRDTLFVIYNQNRQRSDYPNIENSHSRIVTVHPASNHTEGNDNASVTEPDYYSTFNPAWQLRVVTDSY